jgi:peptide deformylase
LATCLLHEIDHLNGVLFIDHLSRLKRDLVMRKFRKNAKHGAPARKDGTGTERTPASTEA